VTARKRSKATNKKFLHLAGWTSKRCASFRKRLAKVQSAIPECQLCDAACVTVDSRAFNWSCVTSKDENEEMSQISQLGMSALSSNMGTLQTPPTTDQLQLGSHCAGYMQIFSTTG